MIWFKCSQICQALFCDLTYALSWRMSLVRLKRMCILVLLNGMICICLLGQFDINCSSNPIFPYWFYVWTMYSLMKVGCWNHHHYLFLLGFFLISIMWMVPSINLLPSFSFFTLISFLSTFILIFSFSPFYFNTIIIIIIMWWKQSLEIQEQLKIRNWKEGRERITRGWSERRKNKIMTIIYL